MTQYEIAAELTGMDGRIRGEQQVRFVNDTEAPVNTLTGVLMLQQPELRIDGSEPGFSDPEGMLRMFSAHGARIFRIPLDVPIRPGESRTAGFAFSGAVPPDEQYHAGAVAACWFWHPLLVVDRAHWSELAEIMPLCAFAVDLTVPPGFETAISADDLTQTVLPDGRRRLQARIGHDHHFIWVSSDAYSVTRASSPAGGIRVYSGAPEAP